MADSAINTKLKKQSVNNQSLSHQVWTSKLLCKILLKSVTLIMALKAAADGADTMSDYIPCWELNLGLRNDSLEPYQARFH